jgi:hypothetical protein
MKDMNLWRMLANHDTWPEDAVEKNDSSPHSHSIVNNAEKLFIFNAVLVGSCTDTMENTMFKNSCKLPGKTAD